MLFLFISIRPNIYSRLGSKPLEGIITVALASLIEGHWRTYILLLFLIGFNPSNVYALFYGSLCMVEFHLSLLELSDKGLRTAPRTYSPFYHSSILYPVLYMCAVCNFF